MQRIVIKSYETKKSIVMPIILLIIGVILFANPGGVMDFISYILGGAFLGLGIWKLLSDYKRENKTTGDMFYSILLIIVGILFIFTGTLDVLIRIILGFWLIINGVNTLAVGANLMKINSKNIVSLIIGFILIIMGIYTILVSNLVLSALGLILTIYSILEIINCIYISIKNK